MLPEKTIKIAKVLNSVEIAITFLIFILFKVLNVAYASASYTESVDSLLAIQTAGLWSMGGISAVVIIITVVLMVKSNHQVKGLGFLLVAGIITLFSAILGVTLGIAVWIFCAASFKTLKQSIAEN